MASSKPVVQARLDPDIYKIFERILRAKNFELAEISGGKGRYSLGSFAAGILKEFIYSGEGQRLLWVYMDKLSEGENAERAERRRERKARVYDDDQY